MQIDRVEVRYVNERGGMELYGLGFFNFDGHTGGYSQMRAKLRLVHRTARCAYTRTAMRSPRSAARVAREGTTDSLGHAGPPFDRSSGDAGVGRRARQKAASATCEWSAWGAAAASWT
jgi:hypothetical protein